MDTMDANERAIWFRWRWAAIELVKAIRLGAPLDRVRTLPTDWHIGDLEKATAQAMNGETGDFERGET